MRNMDKKGREEMEREQGKIDRYEAESRPGKCRKRKIGRMSNEEQRTNREKSHG